MKNRNKQDSLNALVEVRGEEIFTTSLIIAEQFGRPHFRVLKSIAGLQKRGSLTTGVVVSSWIDSTGRTNDMRVAA